jgi:hypothetical protein
MIVVVLGFILITSIGFFIPSLMAGNSREVNVSRGIGIASIVGVIYVIIVAFIVNG